MAANLLDQDWALSFRLNSRFPMRQIGEEVWVDGARRKYSSAASLRIVALNWRPIETTIAVEGIDDHLRPVNLLRLVAKASRSQRLLTAIDVVPTIMATSGAGEGRQFHPGEQPVMFGSTLPQRTTCRCVTAWRQELPKYRCPAGSPQYFARAGGRWAEGLTKKQGEA